MSAIIIPADNIPASAALTHAIGCSFKRSRSVVVSLRLMARDAAKPKPSGLNPDLRAILADRTLFAHRLACGADRAAMRNQEMCKERPVIAWDDFHHLKFHF